MKGVAVPTFAEVAALARALGAGLYVELKARGSGPKCWHELIQHGQHFAVFGSFDPAQVRELRDLGCEWPLSILVGVGYEPLLLADMAGADMVHLCWERDGARPQDKVMPALVEGIFASGREIVLWHEERLPILKEIMQFPVLGICTNRPELMATDSPKREFA
jgi:glycerophosphoryl diester phosphodiesterase